MKRPVYITRELTRKLCQSDGKLSAYSIGHLELAGRGRPVDKYGHLQRVGDLQIKRERDY